MAADFLVDTSVWVDWYRGRSSELEARELALAVEEDRVASCGVIVYELLRGALSDKAVKQIRADQASLRVLNMDLELYEQAALQARALRSKGKTVGLSDSLLDALAQKHDLVLWTKDRDFKVFSRLKLRLA